MKNTLKIKKLENEIKSKKKQLQKLRDKNDLVPLKDFDVFISHMKKKKLSECFGPHSEMILIHNMGFDCAYCTLWADGFNGFSAYFQKRAAFMLENDENPKELFKFAKKRKWKFPVASSFGSDLKKELGFYDPKVKECGGYAPGVTSIIKDKRGNLFKKNSTFLGEYDEFCSLWSLFSLLSSDLKGFQPKWDL